MGEDQSTIRTMEQFELTWQTALSTPPAPLLDEIDPDAERQISQIVNARLRQQFGRSQN